MVVRINRRELQKIGNRWSCPLAVEVGLNTWELEIPLHTHMCYSTEFVVLGQTVRALWRSVWQIWPFVARHSTSLNVGHRNRHGSIGRLGLPMNVLYQPWAISYRFWDKWWFLSKITNFSHPGVFFAPADGQPSQVGGTLELGICAWSQKKTRMMGLPSRERSLTISSAVWLQYTSVTGGRTDGYRPTANTALTQCRAAK